jgi:hypothetical protein
LISKRRELLGLLMLLPEGLYIGQGWRLAILKGGQKAFKAIEALGGIGHDCKSFNCWCDGFQQA